MDSNLDYKINDLASNGYNFEIGRYIGLAWEHFKKNVGLYIGFLFVLILINIVLAFIAIIGSIASALINPILGVGMAIVANKSIRNEPVSFGNFFDGFQGENKPGQLILAAIVMGLIMLACLIPLMGIAGSSLFSIYMSSQTGDIPDMSGLMGAGFSITAFLTMIPLVYLAVAWGWTNFFIVFKKMDFWPAMEASRKVITKKWFSLFLFGIVLGLIGLGGMLCFLVGLLIAVPVIALSQFMAFEQVTGLNEEHEMDMTGHLIDDNV